jgi:hypothetical protein
MAKIYQSPRLALFTGTTLLTALAASAQAQAPASPVLAASAGFTKPAWLTDLSFGFKESYDDNLLQVSGLGMKEQSSWFSTISPKIGFNFAPLLGDQKTFQTLSLVYAPDFTYYHEAPTENYIAHKLNTTIKGKTGSFSFSLDNGFLYNDGSKLAEIYAANQLGGAAANQLDKYRNNYAHAPARERRNQIQDRPTVVFQFDADRLFVRPTAAMIDYDLMTDEHNTSAAPWKGYQNYASRYDVNGGADLGFKATKDLSLLVGYRYGHQYQQQWAAAIDSDGHHSDNDYQRVLFGIEGKPWTWLAVKLAGGPDFRNYNALAPVSDRHLVTYYGEGSMTATLTPSQSLTFNYKAWQWVSSSGKAPEFDSSYGLNYHWNATKQLGLDLGGKIQEADFTCGNDFAGSAPSLRDDAMYSITAGASYAFTPHFSVSVNYAYDLGRNLLDSYVSAPSVASSAPYREFDHQTISLAALYKF